MPFENTNYTHRNFQNQMFWGNVHAILYPLLNSGPKSGPKTGPISGPKTNPISGSSLLNCHPWLRKQIPEKQSPNLQLISLSFSLSPCRGWTVRNGNRPRVQSESGWSRREVTKSNCVLGRHGSATSMGWSENIPKSKDSVAFLDRINCTWIVIQN